LRCTERYVSTAHQVSKARQANKESKDLLGSKVSREKQALLESVGQRGHPAQVDQRAHPGLLVT
jgi:hypothetical protein